MGLKPDRAFRTRNQRHYLLGRVQQARRLIYKHGRGVNSKAVDNLLKTTSSVPTMVSRFFLHTAYLTLLVMQNAFVARLGPDFDIHSLLVVDLLHEFELGVWKSLFTHLIRILYAAGPNGSLVTELDERQVTIIYLLTVSIECSLVRFRQIPNFGSTIRGWVNNASEMKKLAARDFEDLLQVCHKFAS